MSLPPVNVGYWFAGVAAFGVLSVFLAIIKELFSNTSYNQKIKRARDALKGPRTTVPRLLPLLSEPNLIYQKTRFLAFTCQQDTPSKPTEERKLIRSFFRKIDIDVENFIPKGARTVSYAYDGFRFGANCLDFQPNADTGTAHVLTYQMMCSRVQNVYHGDQLAGTCLYFETEPSEDAAEYFTETEYNLMAFYEAVTRQTCHEARQFKFLEKKLKKSRRRHRHSSCSSSDDEPLLRLLAEQPNGQSVVVTSSQRYEFVETHDVPI